jgi:hypothetical protein
MENISLFEISDAKPPRQVLILSGDENQVRKQNQPDYMQFSLPGFGPKFGETGKKQRRKRRVPTNQLSF